MRKTHCRKALPRRAAAACITSLLVAASFAGSSAVAENGRELLTIDHYVLQKSQAPPIAGQYTQLYVRERVLGATLARAGDLTGRVALFVHGAGTPSEVAFDVPVEGMSWMAYLAAAGFDVFAVDMTGYGRSTRPHVMNDPCNLSEEAQTALGIGIASAPCTPSYTGDTTTIESDWADIDRAVDYIRELRDVETVSLLAWSLGGPRAGGYAARHPEKVERLVLLAPAYSRTASETRPAAPAARPAMSSQSYADFLNYWNGPAQCANQRDAQVGAVIFSEMLASDPVGATWGPGVRRAPSTGVWGWTPSVVGRSQTPALLVAPAFDASVAPERVRELYEDYGAENKVLIDLGCATHGAMWESVHEVLFAASLEWLRAGTVEGESQGVLRMGYEEVQ